MPNQLQDRIAIVTGSDSGIGQAVAEEFARNGADVTITYFRDEEGAQETKRRVEACGRRAIIVQADLRDEKAAERIFDETIATLGTPHILVNNAGIDATGTQVAEMTLDDWDRVIRTNLYGPFFCCRRFIQERRKQGGGGKIVNVTSVHEEIPRVGSAAYDSSKGGLRNLTRTLALELAPDRINVNNLAPGMILTPMNQAAIDDREAYDRQVQNIPWKRAGEPWEVAKLALFLASEDADYITGQSFTIDGGLEMNMGQGA
ncbi:SDR family oxidoreductase [Telmatospirillum sp. J64-1]|uniref:SDR family oxidoreductase n=1 Tax=Telmatospirillum sp. J64-1 TaxID=2502183 RepID=UPI00115CF77D|nr:SDR family oxidoreductase [Telmatospirillum sp. J64-1]